MPFQRCLAEGFPWAYSVPDMMRVLLPVSCLRAVGNAQRDRRSDVVGISCAGSFLLLLLQARLQATITDPKSRYSGVWQRLCARKWGLRPHFNDSRNAAACVWYRNCKLNPLSGLLCEVPWWSTTEEHLYSSNLWLLATGFSSLFDTFCCSRHAGCSGAHHRGGGSEGFVQGHGDQDRAERVRSLRVVLDQRGARQVCSLPRRAPSKAHSQYQGRTEVIPKDLMDLWLL